MNISATNFSNAILDTFSKFCEKEIIYNKNSVRGSKQSSKSNTNSENKPWIDDRCKALHQEYRKSLSTFKTSRTPDNHVKLVDAKKKCKTVEIRVKRTYQRHEGNQLEFLRLSNPKSFFRVFKGATKRKNTTLWTLDFYEHFKNIANNNTDYEDPLLELSEPPVFPELDSPFTIDEINRPIAVSKLDKSAGFDNVLIEFFKNFSNVTSFNKTVQCHFECRLLPNCFVTRHNCPYS